MGYFSKEWLVFFYDPPNEEWYHIFRKKGMAHCGACYYDTQKGVWVVLEHIHKRLDVSILQGDDKWRLFQAAWLREHSCVTIVMRLIGINRLIITPFQLYKYLIKNGSTKWAFLEHQNTNQIQS